jgi:hypothetical protein
MSTINSQLLEAEYREYMDDDEKLLKQKLIDLLHDDGKGHHHAKYAKRLKKFDIQIVPIKADPNYTAAIYYDYAIIRIGEGFLVDSEGKRLDLNNKEDKDVLKALDQLGVLLRHELAHSLLMHQIRLAHKLGEMVHVKTSLSASLHRLKNLISDDEISNRKYTEEDKKIVRDMTLNGTLIGGLVTEDHRKSWLGKSVEEMWELICIEIDNICKKLKRGSNLQSIARSMDMENDPVDRQIIQTYAIYSDTESDSTIPGDLKTFIDNGCRVGDSTLRKDFAYIVHQIYKVLSSKPKSDEEIKKLIIKVAQSSPVKKLDLFGNKKVELYTPEEKYIAIETLKKFRSDYTLWYDKVISSLDELTDDELQELIELLK